MLCADPMLYSGMEITTKGINISLEPQEAHILSAVLANAGEDDPYGKAMEETGLDIGVIVPFMERFEKELYDKI